MSRPERPGNVIEHNAFTGNYATSIQTMQEVKQAPFEAQLSYPDYCKQLIKTQPLVHTFLMRNGTYPGNEGRVNKESVIISTYEKNVPGGQMVAYTTMTEPGNYTYEISRLKTVNGERIVDYYLKINTTNGNIHLGNFEAYKDMPDKGLVKFTPSDDIADKKVREGFDRVYKQALGDLLVDHTPPTPAAKVLDIYDKDYHKIAPLDFDPAEKH